MTHRPLTFEHSIVITAAPDAVLAAFFDPAALTASAGLGGSKLEIG